jgi:hypothetical protein
LSYNVVVKTKIKYALDAKDSKHYNDEDRNEVIMRATTAFQEG